MSTEPPPSAPETRGFQSNREFIAFLYRRILEKRRLWLIPLLLLLIVASWFFNLAGKESVLPALYFIF